MSKRVWIIFLPLWLGVFLVHFCIAIAKVLKAVGFYLISKKLVKSCIKSITMIYFFCFVQVFTFSTYLIHSSIKQEFNKVIPRYVLVYNIVCLQPSHHRSMLSCAASNPLPLYISCAETATSTGKWKWAPLARPLSN